MAIQFKILPIHFPGELTPKVYENVIVKVEIINNVDKNIINFTSKLYQADVPDRTSFQNFACSHDMIGGNVYQQCYEYLKKQLNVCGYSNI